MLLTKIINFRICFCSFGLSCFILFMIFYFLNIENLYIILSSQIAFFKKKKKSWLFSTNPPSINFRKGTKHSEKVRTLSKISDFCDRRALTDMHCFLYMIDRLFGYLSNFSVFPFLFLHTFRTV